MIVLKAISGHFRDDLLEVIKAKKSFRICGDNLNFSVGVAHERYGEIFS